MKIVTIRPLNDQVPVRTESNILDSLLVSNCDVAMACGGEGICATCHVHILDGAASLTPMTEREKRTLALVNGADHRSRLACQSRVIGEGVVVEIPEGMYLSSIEDIESLVGRRAEFNIIHPQDGRLLIAKGNIITKSKIIELEDENLNIMDVRSRSHKV